MIATRGRWTPSPLFPDAPPGSGSCIYTWEGEPSTPIDRDALLARFRPVGVGELTPLCGTKSIFEDVTLDRIPLPASASGAGAIGCDVCGIQKDGKVWLILPLDIYYRQFTVKLSSGAEHSFELTTDPSVRAASLELPPPPAGTAYLNGRIVVY